MGRTNVFSSGDLIEDLTHNSFLETGAPSQKLRVYETVEHPAARALTGYLLVRGGVHQIAHARAHPETGEPLEVVDGMPEGAPPFDLPAQPSVFAPDYAPEEIAEIAKRLRVRAGLGEEPTGVVANPPSGIIGAAKTLVDEVTPS